MKTAFSTNGNSIEERIEPAFGRCKNFLIVDSESGDVMVVPNPGFSSPGGAGVRAAQALIGLGVDKLVTGSVGINARPLLDDAGISVVTGESGRISAHLAASLLSSEKVQPLSPACRPQTEPSRSSPRERKPTGYCFCERCGYRTDDDAGFPCFKLKCPDCGSILERKFN